MDSSEKKTRNTSHLQIRAFEINIRKGENEHIDICLSSVTTRSWGATALAHGEAVSEKKGDPPIPWFRTS